MRITVHVKLRSKKTSIVKNDDGSFTVAVHTMPIDGRANEAVIRVLADFFHVPPSSIVFVSGITSKTKVFEL
jgi:uncharacterized protein YggU (UPF0235/DUF167 family)